MQSSPSATENHTTHTANPQGSGGGAVTASSSSAFDALDALARKVGEQLSALTKRGSSDASSPPPPTNKSSSSTADAPSSSAPLSGMNGTASTTAPIATDSKSAIPAVASASAAAASISATSTPQKEKKPKRKKLEQQEKEQQTAEAARAAAAAAAGAAGAAEGKPVTPASTPVKQKAKQKSHPEQANTTASATAAVALETVSKAASSEKKKKQAEDESGKPTAVSEPGGSETPTKSPAKKLKEKKPKVAKEVEATPSKSVAVISVVAESSGAQANAGAGAQQHTPSPSKKKDKGKGKETAAPSTPAAVVKNEKVDATPASPAKAASTKKKKDKQKQQNAQSEVPATPTPTTSPTKAPKKKKKKGGKMDEEDVQEEILIPLAEPLRKDGDAPGGGGGDAGAGNVANGAPASAVSPTRKAAPASATNGTEDAVLDAGVLQNLISAMKDMSTNADAGDSGDSNTAATGAKDSTAATATGGGGNDLEAWVQSKLEQQRALMLRQETELLADAQRAKGIMEDGHLNGDAKPEPVKEQVLIPSKLAEKQGGASPAPPTPKREGKQRQTEDESLLDLFDPLAANQGPRTAASPAAGKVTSPPRPPVPGALPAAVTAQSRSNDFEYWSPFELLRDKYYKERDTALWPLIKDRMNEAGIADVAFDEGEGYEFDKSLFPYNEENRRYNHGDSDADEDLWAGVQEIEPLKDGPRTFMKTATSQERVDYVLGLQALGIYKINCPRPQDRNKRYDTAYRVQKAIRARWPGADVTVEVFGSTVTMIDKKDSDVDLVLLDGMRPHGAGTPYMYSDFRSSSQDIPRLPHLGRLWPQYYSVYKVADALRNSRQFFGVTPITATVSIVKFKDRKNGIEADININERFGLINSRMIKAYCDLRPSLVRPLIFFFKKWAAAKGLNDPSGKNGEMSFSSYTLVLIVINYLQCAGVLPNLQDPAIMDLLEIPHEFMWRGKKLHAGGKPGRPGSEDVAYDVTWYDPREHKEELKARYERIFPNADKATPEHQKYGVPSVDVPGTEEVELGRHLRGLFHFLLDYFKSRWCNQPQMMSVSEGGLVDMAAGINTARGTRSPYSKWYMPEFHQDEPCDNLFAGGASPASLHVCDTCCIQTAVIPDNFSKAEIIVQDPFILDRNTAQNVGASVMQKFIRQVFLAARQFIKPLPGKVADLYKVLETEEMGRRKMAVSDYRELELMELLEDDMERTKRQAKRMFLEKRQRAAQVQAQV